MYTLLYNVDLYLSAFRSAISLSRVQTDALAVSANFRLFL